MRTWRKMFAGEEREASERIKFLNLIKPEEYEEIHKPTLKFIYSANGVGESNIDEDVIGKLVKMLSGARLDDYRYWSRLCWILKNLGDGYHDLFLWASSRSYKFDGSACDELWQSGEYRGLGVATLKYWAKENKPEEYRSLMWTEKNKSNHEAMIEFCAEEVL